MPMRRHHSRRRLWPAMRTVCLRDSAVGGANGRVPLPRVGQAVFAQGAGKPSRVVSGLLAGEAR
jgi:hypothetical protein